MEHAQSKRFEAIQMLFRFKQNPSYNKKDEIVEKGIGNQVWNEVEVATEELP